MFEKEAEDKAFEKYPLSIGCGEEDIKRNIIYEEGFKDGAEFGYNKANEWHKVANGDLPKDDDKIVLCVCGNGFINGKRNYILKLLTRREFPLFQPVYQWKEIVLPKETEND